MLEARDVMLLLAALGPSTAEELSEELARSKGYGPILRWLFCSRNAVVSAMGTLARHELVTVNADPEMFKHGVLQYLFGLTEQGEARVAQEQEARLVMKYVVADYYELKPEVITDDFVLPYSRPVAMLSGKLMMALHQIGIMPTYRVALHEGMLLEDVIDQYLFPQI